MTVAMNPEAETNRNNPLPVLVAALPEIYQPIFGHPELSARVSRSSDDRLAQILAVHNALVRMLDRPVRVLDLGCAQGFFSHHLASHGAVVHGIDFLEANIAVCNALADERGDAISLFETKTVDEALMDLKADEYDLVLGLSVFHHLIHEKGFSHVRELYRGLASNALACLFELALAEEPLYWGPSQPASPRQQLDDFAFVHEISRIQTHLSEFQRPLYFASSKCWFFGTTAEKFGAEWTTLSNISAGDTHQGTRRFFFANGLVAKQFRLDNAARGSLNKQEWHDEVELLRAPPTDLTLPKLIEFGNDATEAWLVRESLPGETLDRKFANKLADYDRHQILRDVLQQLVRLEKCGLYHQDVRTWNVLVDTDGRGTLIDYGAIKASRKDVAWPHDPFLSFIIFMREVTCGQNANPYPRSPWLDPDALPEPYRQAVWSMLRTSKEEWSFARFSELLAETEKHDEPASDTLGISAVIQSLQNEIEANRECVSSLEGQHEQAAALDCELSKTKQQLDDANRWAKALETRSTQLEADIAARDRELELARSQLGELPETLTRIASWASSLEADLIEKNERLTAIYRSSSWRITAPMRIVSRTARRATTHMFSWIAFNLGLFPRLRTERLARWAFDIIAPRPRLLRLVKAVLTLSPPLKRRLQAAVDPLRPFMALIVPPPWLGSVESIPLPFDERVAFNRLLQAAQYTSKGDPLEALAPGSKRRLAYVSPMPPEKSGIADFSAQFLPSLSEHYQIDIISPQATLSDPWVTANCGMRDVAWFEQNAHVYDRVLYHFGNSPFHSHMFSLLERIPGVVVLHDFYLGNVINYLQSGSGWTNFWTTSLVRSHGYPAVESLANPDNLLKSIWNYPTNFPVLATAQGIIVHNEHARKLCNEFYPGYDAHDWAVLPLAKSSHHVAEREHVRAKLGIPPNAFVACSFGYAQSTKLSHRILDAWLASSLSDSPECHLIFVGGTSDDAYGNELAARSGSRSMKGRVKITGFVPTETYRDYLHAADAALQLRIQSRGETSAAILDCLAHGIPTIINAHGAMAELPHGTTVCLNENFTDGDLANALSDLWKQDDLRSRVGRAARKLIEEQHTPKLVAKKYFDAIEDFARTSDIADHLPALIKYVRDHSLAPSDTKQILDHARLLRRESPIKSPSRQLLIDISVIVRDDYRTGIQRVVRAQLMELLKSPPQGYRVEPIWLHNDFGEWRYLYARRYVLGVLGIERDMLSDEPIEVGAGDVFLGADFFTTGVIGAARSGLYDEWRARGVRICFTVYDILPLTLPHRFPVYAEPIHAEWLSEISRVADTLVCISKSVAIETRRWLTSHKIKTSRRLAILPCPLGADIDASSPTVGLPADATTTLNDISRHDSFLMVGTIEPRKGHLQTLEAFETLWRQGVDVKLIIVGARGWKGLPDEQARTIPLIVERLQNHPELGRRLIWLDGTSDEYLEKIYGACICLIAASEDEGFGLPLIEAARHNLPILARDIPVFREVAGEHATYFRGETGEDLASAIRSWLDLRTTTAAPESGKMRWFTWKENVDQLKEILLSADRAGVR